MAFTLILILIFVDWFLFQRASPLPVYGSSIILIFLIILTKSCGARSPEWSEFFCAAGIEYCGMMEGLFQHNEVVL